MDLGLSSDFHVFAVPTMFSHPGLGQCRATLIRPAWGLAPASPSWRGIAVRTRRGRKSDSSFEAKPDGRLRSSRHMTQLFFLDIENRIYVLEV